MLPLRTSFWSWCHWYTSDASVERVALRAEQDAEYQRAVEADEARQRLEGPVDEAAVRAARLRHWLQSP